MTFLDEQGLARLWTHIVAKLGAKVDKVSGKGLSTNDFTTEEKNKLAGIAEGANNTVVDAELSNTSANPVQNAVVSSAIEEISALVGDTSVATQISEAIAGKADAEHNHNDVYYTKTEIDNMEFVAVEDIDTICGASVVAATLDNEVTF